MFLLNEINSSSMKVLSFEIFVGTMLIVSSPYFGFVVTYTFCGLSDVAFLLFSKRI